MSNLDLHKLREWVWPWQQTFNEMLQFPVVGLQLSFWWQRNM